LKKNKNYVPMWFYFFYTEKANGAKKKIIYSFAPLVFIKDCLNLLQGILF